MRNKILVAALLAAAAFGGYWLNAYLAADGTTTPAETGNDTEAPAKLTFALPDLDGQMHSADEWAGRARLVNFWATWCAPCRREIPLLIQTQQAHADDNLQVIGIAVDFAEDVRRYAADVEFNYPILVGGQEKAIAVAESSGVHFVGLPFTLVVAPDGTLLTVHMGEIVEAQIDSIVRELGRLARGDTDIAGARAALRRL